MPLHMSYFVDPNRRTIVATQRRTKYESTESKEYPCGDLHRAIDVKL